MSSNTSSAAGCLLTADAAFGPAVEFCRSGFDFTISFEQYFFTILPASVLLLAAPLRLGYLRSLRAVPPILFLRSAKLSTAFLFAALQLVLVILWATKPESLGHLKAVCTAASSISFVAGLTISAVSYTESRRSIRPSAILNAYLLISLLLDVAIVRSLWLADVGAPIRGVFIAVFLVKAALLVLEAWERPSLQTDGGLRNPEATSGIYNQGLFWWINPLLADGFRRLLSPGDLYGLDESMGTAVLNEHFWVGWNRASISRSRYKLLWICLRALKWPLLLVVPGRLSLLCFTICQPLILNRFLRFLQTPSDDIHVGYGLVGAYFLVYLGMSLSGSFYNHRNSRAVTMLRGVLMSAVFTKTTEMRAAADNGASITLMSTDVDQIIRAFQQFHELWANTIQIGLAAWLLSLQIGLAVVGPVAVCVIASLLMVATAPRAQGSMVRWIEKVEKRIGITSTMLGHMKNIKMAGLAGTLSDTIANLRAEEMRAATPFRVVNAITFTINFIPQLLSPVAAFALFTIQALKTGEALDATRMFSSVSLIVLLGSPLTWTLEAVFDIVAAVPCLKRINAYLSTPTQNSHQGSASEGHMGEANGLSSTVRLHNQGRDIELDELDGRTRETASTGGTPGEPHPIDVRNASFSWAAEGSATLSNIDLSVPQGKLAILVGPVAAGKTTLLKGLLGEVPRITGHVAPMPLRTSWCEQTPWLLNDTIKKNIITFSDFEPDLYRRVVHACDLEKDFAQLANGDETVVGSKGIALSGGQKQRITLARAAYSRPQIALFDDVLSGLDSHTAQTVFDRLFRADGGLFRSWGATVVLSTQTVMFLPAADLIFALAKEGTLSQVPKSDRQLGPWEREYSHAHADKGSSDADGVSGDSPAAQAGPAAAHAGREERRLGDFTVYRYFFGNIGTPVTAALIAVEVFWAFFSTFPPVWLTWWSEANAEAPNQDIGYYLGVYAGLQVLAALSFFLLGIVGTVIAASRWGINLHHKLLRAVMLAPLSVFTSTDIGSMTNRFSQDMGLIDRNLPLALVVSIGNALTVIGTGALIASSTGFIAISFPFLVAAVYLVQKTYLRTSRQLRFLDLDEKAPVYTQFLETVSGLTTIRAFGWGGKALALNHRLVDRAQRPFYLLLMVQQWLTLVLDLMVAALAVLLVGAAVALRGSVSVGLTGVALVQLITLAESVKLLIQFWTSLETSIGAVARIKTFADETPDENLPGETREPPPGWPAHGRIDLRGVSASYGSDLHVKALDGVSLYLKPGEKVGICGRTGSGKSSLLLALLRLLDLSTGTITIDGEDLSTLRRDAVRARLLAVPQDAFALPGTIADNLSPYAAPGTSTTTTASSAAAAEAALRRVGLWDAVCARGGLAAPFTDDLLSHGQRQLFALARALLRAEGHGGGGVVLLDEATGSVDADTEARVREVLREALGAWTVVAVAHRLETIVDFDRVLVLEAGCVVEEGRPAELLAGGGNGRFKALWEASRGREDGGGA